MTTVHTTGLPAAPAVRGRNLLVATGFGVAATVMYFAGLFGVYWHERSVVRNANPLKPTEAWLGSDARIELTPPGMIMWTLIISVAVMQWAVYAIKRDDRPHALLAIGATLTMGAMVLAQSAWQFAQMGLVADTPPVSATLIYTIAGSYMAAIVLGMVFIALVGFRALAGQYSSHQTDGIVAASFYWYTLVFIYFIIWIGVFIAK